MTEKKFWQLIDAAWEDSPRDNLKRMVAVQYNNEDELEDSCGILLDEIIPNFEKRLKQLNKEELTQFIHIMEERLYHIDRKEIHEFTDGSDDGFLYCRCFIIAMGKDYYDMIDQDPSKATADLEAEDMGFIAYRIYQEKFGEEFVRNSIHCIESGSNIDAWSS